MTTKTTMDIKMHLKRNHTLIIALLFLIGISVTGLSLYTFKSAPPILSAEDKTNDDKSIQTDVKATPPSVTQADKKAPVPAVHLTLDQSFDRIVEKERNREKSTQQAHALAASLSTHLDDTQSLLEQIAQTDTNDSTNSLNLLESKTHELDVIKEEVLTHLHQLQGDSAPDSKQNKALKDYKHQVTERFEQLNSRLMAVVSSDDQNAQEKNLIAAQHYLNTLKPPVPEFTEPAPTFTYPPKNELPEENKATRAAPPAYSQYSRSLPLMLAANGDLSALGITLPDVDSEAQSCDYKPEDLAEAAPEIFFDEKILKLAKKLDFNPLKIYEYVANHISYQAYFGSLKGATATLVSGSGNATDQASLIIALLRVSKIPARYVRGNIDFAMDDERGLNWMGAKALEGFRQIAPGQWHNSEKTRYGLNAHTWVEACVPYDNYRGSRADASGYNWIPLDPSYEQKDYRQGTTVPGSFDLNDFFYGTNGYMLKRSLQLPHEAFEARLAQTLGRAIEPIGYQGTKQLIKQDILPSSLPYHVREFIKWGDGISQSDTAALPQSHRYVFRITVKSSRYIILHPKIEFTMPAIALKRMTLRFDGATQAQVDDSSCAANPSVIPVISVDGVDQNADSKQGVALCTDNNQLLMEIHLGRKVINRVNYRNIGAHNYHALQAYALQASALLIEERSNALLASVGQIDEPNSLQDETLGEFLHITGLKYMDYITQANVRIGALYDSYGILGKHLGLTSTRKTVSYLFDLPFAISGDGFLIDIAGGQGGAAHLSTGVATNDAFLLSGYASSAYESYIWQEMAHLDAVSSVRGIQFANESGNDVVTLSASDILPKPWASITLDSNLSYACPALPSRYRYSNNSSAAYTQRVKSNFTPVNLYTLSNTDTAKNTLKGIYRYNGQGFHQSLAMNWSDGYSVTCPLITPAIQLPRNPVHDPDALAGYSQTLLKNIAEAVLAGKTIHIPQKTIQYDNWAGAAYIAVDGFSATFAINGGYPAGGGYATHQPLPTFDSGRGTGSANIPVTSVNNTLLTGTSTPSSSYIPPNITTNTAGLNTGINPATSTMSGDPVNLVSGNLYLPETDFRLKGVGGLDMVFKRHYNANMRKDGPLGFGWTHSFNHSLNFFDAKDDGKTNQVVWIDGSGATRYFSVTGGSGGIANNTLFTNPDGVYVTAQRDSTGEYRITEKNGLSFIFENKPGSKGTIAKLLRVVDRNNNTIHLTYDASGNLESVKDDLNHTIDFYYDNNDPHITRIEDWSGRSWRYTYTDNNLVKVETTLALEGKETPTTYEYYTAADGENLDHALLRYTRPTGKSMTFEYYTNAKVFRHSDNLNNTYTFRYNEFRRETTTIDERGIKQSYLFNEYGQQVHHTQGDGAQLSYEYSDSTQPLNETLRRHALGYETQYQYDNTGNVIRTTLPDNSTIQSIGLTAYNSPCTLRDNNGHYTLNRYDSKGNLSELITLKKDSTLNPADESNCSYTPPVNTILSWQINTYNSKGLLLTSKQVKDFASQSGPYAEYLYDDQFNPVTVKRCGQQQDHTGQLTQRCVNGTQDFDTLGRAVTLLDGDFYSTAMQYDANGRLARTTDALNQWHDLRYDKQGRLIGESMMASRNDGQIDFLLNNTIAYDVMDRPIVTRNITGASTRTEYDETGNITRLTNPDGYAVRFAYDKQNRPVKAFDEQGHAVSTQYDIGGRPVKTTDPNGNSTHYTYYGASENGRLQTIKQNNTDSTQRTLTYFYDNNGNVIRTRDDQGRENLTDYDALNRPVRSVGPLFDGHGLTNIRQVTQTTYNTLGDAILIQAGYTTNTTGQTGSDVLKTQARYTFDDFGRLLTETDANGKSSHYFYDDHNNLNRTESANGHITSMTYDHTRHGLLIKQTAQLSSTDSNPKITSYTYDALGQITQVTTSGGTTDGTVNGTSVPAITYTYEHDRAGRLVKVTDSRGNKSLHYDFSPGGLLNSISDSDNKRSDFLYDAASRLTAIMAPNGERVNLVFDAGGRLLESNIAEGVSSRYRYDAGNHLTQLVNRSQNGIISQHDYTYDSAGRKETQTETIAGTTSNNSWQYDALNQLTSVLTDGTTTEQYSYDQFGNRRTRQLTGQTKEHYLYDNAQQLLSIHEGSDSGTQSGSFSYDDNGNLTAKTQNGQSRSFSYDALDQLTQVTGNDSDTENYHYDHQGRRITKTVGTTSPAVTQYLYSGLSIHAEYGIDWNTALAHYTYTGLDQAIIRSTPDAANTRYYHHDGLGSVVAVSDNAGNTQGSTRYGAFGQVIASAGNQPLFGFTGREPDATGLIFYRARYYDPTLGRFTQRDPLGFADGINPYIYVGNSPQNFTDPLGLISQVPNIANSNKSTFDGKQIDVGSLCGHCPTLQGGKDTLNRYKPIADFIGGGIQSIVDGVRAFNSGESWKGAALIGLGITDFVAKGSGKFVGGISKRVRTINGRVPINSSKYSGKTVPLKDLPRDIRNKYPHSVPFSGAGFPDFSRYSTKNVRIELGGSRGVDFGRADKAAGFSRSNPRPSGTTWHHHQESGYMQLVPTDLHDAIKHTGGIATGR